MQKLANKEPPLGSNRKPLIFSDFVIRDILQNGDEPSLFTCVDRDDNLYIALFVDEIGDLKIALYSQIDEGVLAELIAGKLSVRQVILSPNFVYAVFFDINNPIEFVEKHDTEKIAEKWLPSSHWFL